MRSITILVIYAFLAFVFIACEKGELFTITPPKDAHIEFLGETNGYDRFRVTFATTPLDTIKIGYSHDGADFRMPFTMPVMTCAVASFGLTARPDVWVRIEQRKEGIWFEQIEKAK